MKANLNNVNICHSGSKFAWNFYSVWDQISWGHVSSSEKPAVGVYPGGWTPVWDSTCRGHPRGSELTGRIIPRWGFTPFTVTVNPTHHPVLTWVLPILLSVSAASSSSPAATPSAQNTSYPTDPGTPARVVIGLALTFGFTLMFVVDQISTYFSTRG